MKIKKSYKLKIQGGNNLISESFGLQDGYDFNICDIDIPNDYQIIYITGESGSGKSTIAREAFGVQDVQLPEIPLYLLNGESNEQQVKCLEYLGICGITDAVQFVSKPSQLSDSQIARAKIAYQMILGFDLIVVDEFLSTLDRKTAKAVSYCIQKAIRKTSKKLIAITAHDDLECFLMPDYTISGKAYPSKFVVKKNNYEVSVNPYTENINFHYGDKFEYRNCDLGLLHYKGKYTGGTKEFLFAEINSEIVAVLVSTYNRATGGRRISRVVVHPTFRGIGVGTQIVKKYIHDFPGTDVVASMALFNPVFEKAGMKRVSDSVIKSPKGLKKQMKEMGLDENKWHDKNYCVDFCRDGFIRDKLSEFSSFATDLICPGGKYSSNDEIIEKIKKDYKTAGRVLFQLRERKYAKFISSITQ